MVYSRQGHGLSHRGFAATAGIELEKWYMDCVTGSGDAFIGYCATLRRRALSIHYANALEYSEGEGVTSRSSLRKSPPPVLEDGDLSWHSRSLGVEGCWHACETPVSAVLLESEDFGVEWRCHIPRARAEVRIGRGRRMEGWGYAESLLLRLARPELPIRTLHWGRFLAEADSVIWIDWQGPHSARLMFHNGARVDAEAVAQQGVAFGDPRTVLSLDSHVVLREGALSGSVFSLIPGAEKIFPARILAAREVKWRSRGVLRRAGCPDVQGWAIHEVVEWP